MPLTFFLLTVQMCTPLVFWKKNWSIELLIFWLLKFHKAGNPKNAAVYVSLKLTVRLNENRGPWKRRFRTWKPSFLRGYGYVSFRECVYPEGCTKKNSSWPFSTWPMDQIQLPSWYWKSPIKFTVDFNMFLFTISDLNWNPAEFCQINCRKKKEKTVLDTAFTLPWIQDFQYTDTKKLTAGHPRVWVPSSSKVPEF